MNKIVVKADSLENLFAKQKKPSKRGAHVYGIPVCHEIASYVEDVSPEASKQRLVSMFFGGNYSLLAESAECLDEDDLEEYFLAEEEDK